MVTEKTAVANSVFESSMDYSTHSDSAYSHLPSLRRNSTTPALPSGPTRVVVGQVRVKGNNLKVWFFGYSIRDPAWASFTLESYPQQTPKQLA